MGDPFRKDAFPGAGRVLFVGDVHGSHARSWMNIVQGGDVNVRCFGLANGAIPQDFRIPAYSPLPQTQKTVWHRPIMTNSWTVSTVMNSWNDLNDQALMKRALHKVIRSWNPDIVHTFGLFPASQFYLSTIDRLQEPRPFWIAQARGGPDIEVNRHLPPRLAELEGMLSRCDGFIADTEENLAAAVELGLDPDKKSSIGRVPGTGGIDVDAIAGLNRQPPSKRERLIVMPKAYEHVQSKMLPVLEALNMCWDQIAPCRFILLSVNEEVMPWLKRLPPHIQDCLEVHERLPRGEILEMAAGAKAVLAPSLLDGIPNVLFEAMAAGAVPIVSPLPTIVPHVSEPENVFFARNLYPREIADALVRALSASADLDCMAQRNLAIVRRIGARDVFVDRIHGYYRHAFRVCAKRGRPDHGMGAITRTQ